jgi:hypothetical protein
LPCSHLVIRRLERSSVHIYSFILYGQEPLDDRVEHGTMFQAGIRPRQTLDQCL